MKLKSLFLAATLTTLGALAATAQAMPTAVTLSQGFAMAPYTGTAAVGQGQVQVDSTLFVIRERDVGGLQSWFVFFDPLHPQRLQAELSFGGEIVDVIDTRSGLAASNPVYGIDVDGDTLLDDYGLTLASGLEAGDSLAWTPGGHTLRIDWLASNPGDHIRVLVAAVPEPGGLALAGAALGVLFGLRGRRRPS